MKTLKQIKDDYAIEQGFSDWGMLCIDITLSKQPKSISSKMIMLEQHMDNVCILAQKQALQNASEQPFTFSRRIEPFGDDFIHYVRKDAITNENNIVR